ncbi:cell envelope integrity protein TolA [Desulfobulbus alkaliphilus]|uniref:cell envelope integrity protein TolA n=1 Tax=Desulfobulbus alkaliphilus TaxID=869814 RepID=UPI0019648B7B|nr:cell envelope integrity protein TolA [Desulfobulbus alkaliphilus]
MSFSETDFHLHRQADEKRWGMALLLAMGAHIGLFVLAIYLPSLFDTRTIATEIVAVSLVSMPEEFVSSEAAAPAESAAPPAAEPVDTPPPEPPSESVAPPEPPPPPESTPVSVPAETAVVPVPPEPAATAEPVSLVAPNRKVRVAQDTRLEEERIREQAARQRQQEERELAQRIEERQRQAEQRRQVEQRRQAEQREVERQRAIAAQAEEERRRAEEELRRLRAEAEAATAAAVAARNAADREAQAVRDAVNRPGSGRQQAQTMVEQQYLSSVAQRVRSYWVLPEMRSWDTALLAQVVITINKEGEVLRIQFDQRSRDPLFDQLVERTIRNASPMPRFPSMLHKDSIEVGFNFKPGELGNI